MTTVAFGYERPTHRLINNKVYVVSSTDEYFRGELGFSLDSEGRIADTYPKKQPWQLFEDAGDAEDGWPTYWRAYNHYHDPIRSWEGAGYTNPRWFNGISGILWAQYNRLESPPSLVILSLTGGNAWSWDNAYQYFLDGLTASDDATRKQNLANLFTALGRLTHLVADMSVPEHSRNDGHVLRSYEGWSKENLKDVNSRIYGVPVFDNTFMPHLGIFAQGQGSAFGSGPLSPVSNLWDSQSSGSGYNPLLSGTERLAGLADYSNYNYFSGDTVFDNTTYDDPSRAEAWLDTVLAKDGKIDKVIYFKRLNSDGVPVSHLAAAKMLYKDFDGLSAAERGTARFSVAAQLDDNCWEEYASNLVPRAVSYGTALVNYFFRGRIDVTPEGSALKLTNRSPGGLSGSVTVYFDDPSGGLRKPVAGLSGVAVTLPLGGSVLLAAGGAPPASQEKRYTLVFSGVLENLDASGRPANTDRVVAGKVFSWEADETIFMVDLEGQALKFDLSFRNGRYELIPSSKTIPFGWDRISFSQTIQSNPSRTQHFAALPFIMRDGVERYGISVSAYWYGYLYYLSHGSPYTYRPADFTSGSPYVLDSNRLYDWMSSPQAGEPFAAGRNNYTLDAEGRLVSHHNSVWRKYMPDGTVRYYFRYKTDFSDLLVDQWTDGANLGPGLTPHAVVGRESALATTIPGWEEPIRLKLGGEAIGESEILHWTNEVTSPRPLVPGVDFPNGDPTRRCYRSGVSGAHDIGVLYTASHEERRPELTVLDYDNVKDENSFVVVYEKAVWINDYVYKFTFDQNCSMTANQTLPYIKNADYILHYRVNGIGGDVLLRGHSTSTWDGWTTSTTTGEKIRSVSVKIGDNFIVYTYAVDTPQGNQWTYAKRVVGIVNLADPASPVGYRQEFDIDFSGSNFFGQWPVAIGTSR